VLRRARQRGAPAAKRAVFTACGRLPLAKAYESRAKIRAKEDCCGRHGKGKLDFRHPQVTVGPNGKLKRTFRAASVCPRGSGREKSKARTTFPLWNSGGWSAKSDGAQWRSKMGHCYAAKSQAGKAPSRGAEGRRTNAHRAQARTGKSIARPPCTVRGDYSMGLLNQLGIGTGSWRQPTCVAAEGLPRTPAACQRKINVEPARRPLAVGPHRSAAAGFRKRIAFQGLKEFLGTGWIGSGTLADRDQAWKTTLNFYRGGLGALQRTCALWKDFADEEKNLQKAATSTDAIDLTPGGARRDLFRPVYRCRRRSMQFCSGTSDYWNTRGCQTDGACLTEFAAGR